MIKQVGEVIGAIVVLVLFLPILLVCGLAWKLADWLGWSVIDTDDDLY